MAFVILLKEATSVHLIKTIIHHMLIRQCD